MTELYSEFQLLSSKPKDTDNLRKAKLAQSYELWLQCMIQYLEKEPSDLLSTCHPHISELPYLQCLQGLAFSHVQLSGTHACFCQLREKINDNTHPKRALISRVAMAIFRGATLTIPMIIMVMDARKVTVLLTTGISTLAIGLILSFWMEDASCKDIFAATAAYAAALVVFVGTWSRKEGAMN